MDNILNNVVENAGKHEELSHSFFLRVRDMVLAGDSEALIKEKVHTKLLRLSAQANNGFVLLNFPNDRAEAEVLESYKGGLNAFVHVSLPDDILVDIEENKLVCADCGRHYYTETIHNEEYGIHIEPFAPNDDGSCHDCGSKHLVEGSDPIKFEKELENYKANKEELLGFYDHYVSFFYVRCFFVFYYYFRSFINIFLGSLN